MLTSPDRPLTPDSSVWSSLSQPVADRTHWGLWADLQLPQPSDDELRRTREMLLVYQSSRNFSGAALAMRLIGDEHRGRGDYRNALKWYQNSRATLRQAIHDEGERQSVLLDEAITLKALGDTQYLMGRVEDALNSYAESLTLHDARCRVTSCTKPMRTRPTAMCCIFWGGMQRRCRSTRWRWPLTARAAR